ncbi:NAD(P)-dependent oxidoreductase [candidate division KSB1 bacterium]|nr:NAD(P)-dependent oxidoreductase [candidate division KSB1 bacterium]
MRVLITGGAGFLGLHVAHCFARNGWEVICTDIAEFEAHEFPAGTVYVKHDVRDRPGLEKILKERRVDAIVHGAAALPLWKPKDIFDINVEGTRNVLEAARTCGVKRVVFVSSTAVYGIPDHHPLFETDQVQGVGPYGESKILAEAVCGSYRDRLCVCVIRPKTFIGTHRLGVFQILYDWVESGKRIPMIGNGRNRYQLLEVDDLADALYLGATVDAQVANDTFNVGAKEFMTVREDMGAMCDFAGNGARPWGTPAGPVKLALKTFEALGLSPLYKWVYGTADQDSFVSIEKAEQKLGWKPQYSNAQALIRSYQWYLAHKGEIPAGSGITHRIAWNQGILKFFKRFM